MVSYSSLFFSRCLSHTSKGNLFQLIDANRKKKPNAIPINSKLALKIAFDVCSGMTHLVTIIHFPNKQKKINEEKH